MSVCPAVGLGFLFGKEAGGGQIQGVCDKALKGPEGPPRWCHPRVVLLNLVSSEMLSHFLRTSSERVTDRVPLNTEPESGWEKEGPVSQARTLHSFLGYPACSGGLLTLTSLRAERLP